MGQDGHDRGQKVIVSAFADIGLRRRRGPAVLHAGGGRPAGCRRRRPHRRREQSLAAGHLTLLPASEEGTWQTADATDIMVVIGGVIPPGDVPTLEEMGAAAVFLPGTRDRRVRARPAAARLREQLQPLMPA